jgi:argininosuccinate synthase
MLRAPIDRGQETVTGQVRLKLAKGTAAVVGRRSPVSLYRRDLATFERDAEGFIRLNALRLRVLGLRGRQATAPGS